jgi:PIN domain nuclease of toxin-antitoxin system
MKLLLDTHAFMWWDNDPAQLSPRALAELRDPANTVWFSVISVWEMVIKSQLGKLTLHLPLSQIVTQQQANGLQVLAATLEHTLAVEALPPVHKDPFDRLLAAQANVEAAEFVTADPIFARYPVRVLW